MRGEIPSIPMEKIDPQKEIRENRKRIEETRQEEALKEDKKYHPTDYENRAEKVKALLEKWWGGDTHAHSIESDRAWGHPEGIYKEEEMLKYYEKLGVNFIAFTEHTSDPCAPKKIEEDDEISQSFLKQTERIKIINQEGKSKLAVFSAAEASVFFNEKGSPMIDLPPEIAKNLDYVIASLHTTYKNKNFKNIKETLLYATNHPDVDVIGHPDEYIGLKNNWDLFRGYFQEAEEFHKKMTELQKDKEKNKEVLEKMYSFIRKVIGKEELKADDMSNENLMKFKSEFEKMSIPYWQMWDEILDVMAEKGKVFEINFTSPPDDKLLEMAASKNIKFMLHFDTHDFSQFKQETDFIKRGKSAKRRWARGDAKDEDMEALEKYKEAGLTSGPGFKAIFRLAKTIKKLEGWGVTPERIINSSKENMINFLIKDRGKSTENLEFLKNKFIKE